MTTLSLCRFTLAASFAWQGLVPKLLGPHADELALAAAAGLGPAASYAAGAAELGLAAALIALPTAKWPYRLILLLMPLLLAYCAWAAPAFLIGAFNPLVMNLALVVLAVIALRQLEGKA